MTSTKTLICILLHISLSLKLVESFRLLRRDEQLPESPLKFDLSQINTANAPIGKAKVNQSEIANLPERFDARDHWPHCSSVIGHINHQGSCGSCWAVVTTDVISDRLCIATSGVIMKRISAWQLMSCCGLGACADGVMDRGGCLGGDPWGSWKFFKEQGLVTENCATYPNWARFHGLQPFYPENNVTCSEKCEDSTLNYQDEKFYGAGYYRLPNDEATIKKEIFDNGPVVAALNIRGLNPWYHDGNEIFDCGFNPGIPTHGVRLIGWGVDGGSNSNDGTINRGAPYWLAANSWGTYWGGIGGVFKIARGSNACHVEEFVTAGFPRV